MLNILKSKLKNNYRSNVVNKNFVEKKKKFAPLVRSWKNSIYSFNKNTLSLIPAASEITINLIKGYFYQYHAKCEKYINKIAIKKLKIKKVLSTNKIWISNGQFKHTNDLVNITIYFYNRELINYKYIISKDYNKKIRNRLLFTLNKFLKVSKKQAKIKKMILSTINKEGISQIDKIENIQHRFKNIFIKKNLKKYIYYIYLKQLIYINKSKFNNYYLQTLINLVKKIYKKNIEFNFVDVKYFYLNSDILTESLFLSIKKDRRKLLRTLNKILKKPKIKITEEYINYDIRTEKKNVLFTKLLNNNTKSKNLKKTILNNIYYKNFAGLRIRATGRITKRNTASRAQSKLKYMGSTMNIQSSIHNKSSALLRGKMRPNIGYTNINNYTRAGTFGLKGWISGK